MPRLMAYDRSFRWKEDKSDARDIAHTLRSQMTALQLSPDDLSKKLSSLPRRLRTAFAAACAQRLMPAYTRFASGYSEPKPQQATKILDELWNDIENGSSDPSKLKRAVE